MGDFSWFFFTFWEHFTPQTDLHLYYLNHIDRIDCIDHIDHTDYIDHIDQVDYIDHIDHIAAVMKRCPGPVYVEHGLNSFGSHPAP